MINAATIKLIEHFEVERLREDLKTAERVVQRGINTLLTENQYGALVSFAFNLGEANFMWSTVRKKVNAREFEGVAKELSKWVNGGGKRDEGLVRRRKAEAYLFLTPEN